ncbi:hypothetical protein EJ05DRAFT_504345 [Pseudovirgaria hyperparasitica]|uniref:Autophagy-related protein 14 n=1 Tax=Pseudovirgaria hyperparasitica TaxID=470096 RepID=A0A6A6VU81_9PEZI|nr:uncharacterized protein EJ05DRAFT_504345 [Pseudovirgaria hyperparasitica]KAF2754248.1 hypothetical protein EJ05DRAFT_504345 [Pseudovirgaria hyperparasitica]
MDCDICTKALTTSSDCTCVVCARNSIYPLRIEQATVLIEKEKLARQVEAVLKGTTGSALRGSDSSVEPTISLGTSTGGTIIDRHECAKKIDMDRVLAETEEGRERVQMITDKAEELRREIEMLKKQRASKQAAIAKKKSEIASATHGLAERREKEMEHVRRKISSINRAWDVKHEGTAAARAYLCREAALLMGLKHAKRRSRDGSVKDVYYLGQNKIFDLRDLHLAQPDPLCSSLSNISMLLVRISHYLAVRLPNEITVPHRDYPRPTIFSHSNSYLGHNVPFPGTTPSQSTSNSPEASRSLPEHDQHLPRPRALYVDRPLPQLIKEDPTAYHKFLEAVCLLAWDIAWLCKTQGLTTADFSNWEEMCPLGRNLYALLITQPTSSTIPLNRDIARIVGKPAQPHPLSRSPTSTSTTTTTPTTTSTLKSSSSSLGHLSHGTAHSFLPVAGTSKSWRLAPAPRLVDGVKSALLAEMQGAEWEVLREDEWAEMKREMEMREEEMRVEVEEEPVVVGASSLARKGEDGVLRRLGRGGGSVLTTATATTAMTVGEGGAGVVSGVDDGGEGESTKETAREKEKEKERRGVNGWMKLKSRAGGEAAAAGGGAK